MCYDNDARPPDVPGEVGVASGRDVEVTSADGTPFAAYVARGAWQGQGANVVIYPDVRGLHQFYKELALRFAEKGIDAIAIDYFGRTAGIGPRDDSFDHMAHVPRIRFPSFVEDVRAALVCLRGNDGAGSSTFTVGFCMGGSLSLLTGAEDLGLAGVIGFYSGFTRKFEGSGVTALEQAHKIRYPVLDLFGGADPGITEAMIKQLDDELDKAGVEHEIVTYPGAPHSFFDRKATEYARESADAWNRVLGFIAAHSGR